jgi:hypothetical protein
MIGRKRTFFPLLFCCFFFPFAAPNPFTSASRTIDGGFIFTAPPQPGAMDDVLATSTTPGPADSTIFKVGGAEITAVEETEIPAPGASSVDAAVKAPIGRRDVAGFAFAKGARVFGAKARAADQA